MHTLYTHTHNYAQYKHTKHYTQTHEHANKKVTGGAGDLETLWDPRSLALSSVPPGITSPLFGASTLLCVGGDHLPSSTCVGWEHRGKRDIKEPGQASGLLIFFGA